MDKSAIRSTKHTASPAGHAIVIGGSIAGLTAAAVLAKHFAQVTVLERDNLTGDSDFRKGVPQARHPHGLLLRGQLILEQLFPGLVAELIDKGAVPVNAGWEQAFFIFGHWRKPRYRSEIVGTSLSRPLLEGTIYRRLAAHPKVRFMPETEVIGLCTDAEHKCVRGVRWRPRRQVDGEPNELMADLVVDASGRDSHTAQWLTALGYPAPKEEIINAHPGYATRIFRIPPRAAGFEWKLMLLLASPATGKRGGVLFPLEDDRWHVTLLGMAGDYPPTDEDGFWEFARSLPDRALYEAIKDAEPLTPVYGYRRAENQLRRFDQLARQPENFVVTGDAVCALNPVYGQGMSVAVMASEALDHCLRKQYADPAAQTLSGLAVRFQKELVKVVQGPWQMATGQDRLWLTLEGGDKLDLPTRCIQNYMHAVIKTSLDNTEVAEAFTRVQHMVASPGLLFGPSVLFPVLKMAVGSSLARRRGNPELAPQM